MSNPNFTDLSSSILVPATQLCFQFVMYISLNLTTEIMHEMK